MLYKQTMYAISLRHLSGIQKGIQSSHAITEYANEFEKTKEYKQWSREDKTEVLLQVNSSDDLKKIIETLTGLEHKFAVFHEPDIYNVVTSVSFLLDEVMQGSKPDPNPGIFMNRMKLYYITYISKLALATN